MEDSDLMKMSTTDIDLEDGEIGDESDGSYTPLQRPTTSQIDIKDNEPRTVVVMDDTSDQDDPNYRSYTESDSDESDGIRVRKKRREKFRLKPLQKPQPQATANTNKYNIWAASIQEDSLMENMRGCDVTRNEMRNRAVESYDYSIKYRLNGETTGINQLKRRQSNSDDSDTINQYESNKRFRASHRYKNYHDNDKVERKSVKQRLGHRTDDSNSNDSYQNQPKYVLDLNIDVDSGNDHVAREIADKLREKKDDLLLRIVSILGKEIPIKLFKETQRIESDGGMLIMNGARRRTPGGVFLFLLKHNDEVSAESKKLIFIEDNKKQKDRDKKQSISRRDKKVEELKKTLNQQAVDKELPNIPNRKEILMAHLKPDTHSALSNPPPSPVTDVNRESSPEYEAHSININVTSPEKSNRRELELISYDDDILDMTCDDIDDMF